MKARISAVVLMVAALAGCSGGGGSQDCIQALEAADTVIQAHEDSLISVMGTLEGVPGALEDAFRGRTKGVASLTEAVGKSAEDIRKNSQAVEAANYPELKSRCLSQGAS